MNFELTLSQWKIKNKESIINFIKNHETEAAD
jgi:hypothetical protein